MSRKIVTVGGITFDVEFDFQPREEATQYYPGAKESIEITGVSMQGVEIGEIINPYWLSRITEELMEHHNEI